MQRERADIEFLTALAALRTAPALPISRPHSAETPFPIVSEPLAEFEGADPGPPAKPGKMPP